MRKMFALFILSLAGVAFGAYGFDSSIATITLDQADLVTMIDPLGLADVQQSFGVSLDDFRNLAGLNVIDFGHPSGSAAMVPTGVAVNGLVQFNFAAAYSYGGRNSFGRSAFSGTNTYDDISTVETQSGANNCWLDVPSITGAKLTAIGFCACAQTSGAGYFAGPGQAIFTLSDGTTAAIDYPKFGSFASSTLNAIFVGYQAPAGKFITSFMCTRPGSGNSFIAIDDLSFVVQSVQAARPGDTNNDGKVDVTDLGALATYYDATGLPCGSHQSWAMGDFNDDGKVDVTDLGTLATEYDWVAAGSPVPEPATLSLLALAAAAVIRRKR